QAIDFARWRSDAVTLHGGPRGELLSVRGEPARVFAVLRENENQCVITHHNAPQQTVVAGDPVSVAAAKDQLSAAGLASIVIAVPAAFHTPMMATARDVLRTRTSGLSLRPPRFAFLSATQNRYLAEPESVLENLIDQLVQPVGFCGAAERLVRDGCGLLIEVGPNNVLSRLASSTVAGRALCLSLDNRSVPASLQAESVKWACRLFHGGMTIEQSASIQVASDQIGVDRIVENTPTPESSRSAVNAEPKRSFSVVDVTRRGRRGDRAVSDKTTVPHTAPNVEPSNGKVLPAAPAKQADVTAESATDDGARSFLFDLVVDLTGYEPEIIDFDADLEAELGVDSIKKAQLIGELVHWANLNVTTQDIKLSDYRSMADILALMPGTQVAAAPGTATGPTESRGAHGSAEAHESAEARQPVEDNVSVTRIAEPTVGPLATQPSAESAIAQAEVNATPDPEICGDSLKRFMIDLLVDQTGYDEDIIDMDADLEGELGVDSIKRAQLLGELSQQYDLPVVQTSDLKLSDFPTLASIHTFIMDQASAKKKACSDSLGEA
ncbi:MAG: phosphopantetheine-binding protein, partial [Planctomycetota bacterium]